MAILRRLQRENMSQSTFLLAEPPASRSASPDCAGGWKTPAATWPLEYLRLADRLRPRWLVWENVPGVRSSNGGRDFGAFLGGLGQLGYGWAYRSLDAQFFGLAQRRERVFVVGYLGDWRRAAAVLFEPASLRGDSPPRRETRKDLAPTISSRTTGGGGLGTDFDTDGGLIAQTLSASRGAACANAADLETYIPVAVALRGRAEGGTAEPGGDVAFSLRASTGGGDKPHVLAYGGNNTAGSIDVATAVNAHGGPHGRLDFESETFVAHALRADGFDASEDGTGRGTPLVAFQTSQHNGVAIKSGVRRLMPIECERLQGFPDNWTDVPYRGRPAADGPRYKALGNSFAVPVVRWIGTRIASSGTP
jgi:DNA (cytosine-5)-methyltransferase 1